MYTIEVSQMLFIFLLDRINIAAQICSYPNYHAIRTHIFAFATKLEHKILASQGFSSCAHSSIKRNVYLDISWSRCSVSPPVAKETTHPPPQVGGNQTHAVY